MLTRLKEVHNVSTTFFDEVYVFGSSLWIESPNDIDILLVYEDTRLWQVAAEKTRLEAELDDSVCEVMHHFTILSHAELEQTNFLDLVHYLKLK